MYRLSPLPRQVLITTDEVIALGPVDQDVSPRSLLSAIQIAEERFIKPAICKDLYYDLRAQKNIIVDQFNKDILEEAVNTENNSEGITLPTGGIVNALELVSNAWYKALWNEHLWKICAEAVVYIASPTNYTRFTSSGEMENNPRTITGEGQGAASVELSKMKWKLDKILMDRIDPLIAGMHEWLCDYRGNFQYYSCKECYRDADGISYKRKTAWINPYKRKDGCCDENNYRTAAPVYVPPVIQTSTGVIPALKEIHVVGNVTIGGSAYANWPGSIVAFRDGILFKVVRNSTPVDKQINYDVSSGLFNYPADMMELQPMEPTDIYFL